MSLKGQDVPLCLDLALRDGEPWTYQSLANDLGLSLGEAHNAAQRSVQAGLLAPGPEPDGKPKPVRAALLDFLVHGFQHVFFAVPGRIVRGMPTAHSAPLPSIAGSGPGMSLRSSGPIPRGSSAGSRSGRSTGPCLRRRAATPGCTSCSP